MRRFRSRIQNPTTGEIQAKFKQGLALHQDGKLADAERRYEDILQRQPSHYDALHLLGVIAIQTQRTERGVELIKRAIELNAALPAAHSNLAKALVDLHRAEEALESCERAIALKPDYADAYTNRSNALRIQKRFEEALASCDKAIALKPADGEPHISRGNTLLELKRPEEALASYDKAILLKPDSAEAYSNRGTALLILKREEQALASYDKAISLKPDYAEAYNNRAFAFLGLNQQQEALASCNKAIELKSDFADAYNSRGNILLRLKRYEEAYASYDRAFALKNDLSAVEGVRLHTKMHICDWSNLETECEHLISSVRSGHANASPFPLLAISSSSADHLRCAKVWVADKYASSDEAIWQGEQYKHDKIRVAYLSGDLQDHPVSHLMSGVFEQHDRTRFNTIAISFGPDSTSSMQKQLKASFDRFIDVEDKDDLAVASLVRELEIDLAIDLMGYTQNSHTNIFAKRPAPIQVNYLGYPGTLGADFIDYILADRFVIPEEQKLNFSEKVVYLPDSFQANSRRPVAKHLPSRAEAGLPNDAFVFSSFSNNYKITPDIFDVWMRLLREVDNSVLWLLAHDAVTARNLRTEAAKRGVDTNRLIFAPRIPYVDYLARYQLADLFLDTLPFNAGTTASDALWAGLPVITCPGETFASRMAGSLLNAVGCPELITGSLEEYYSLALILARDKTLLASFKSRLTNNRNTHPLFNTKRFTRNLEAAYTAMYERYQAGLAPDHIVLPIATEIPKPETLDLEPDTPDAEALQAQFSQGLALHQQGKLADAERRYEDILQRQPSHYDALHLLGVIAIQTQRTERGVELIKRAIELNAALPAAHNNLAKALVDLQRAEEALESCERAIALKPDYADAYTNRSNALRILKRFEEALASCDKAIALKPADGEPHISRGNTLLELKRPEEALASYDKAILLKPDSAEAYNNRGTALLNLKREEQALASYDKAISLKPDYAEAYNNHARSLQLLKRSEEALVSCDRAIALKPTDAQLYISRGAALLELKRPEEALVSTDKAIALKPDSAEAYNNRGNALNALKRRQEALASYNQAIELNPSFAEAYNNRGSALNGLERRDEALASYDKAIELRRNLAEAHNNRGSILSMLKRYEEAYASYDRAFELNPDLAGAEGARLHSKMHICDWRNFDVECAHLISSVNDGKLAVNPFDFIAIPSSSAEQLRCSRLQIENGHPPFQHLAWQGERYNHKRIHVAYVSADFHWHATSNLMAGMFECHDKSQFEVSAVSLQNDNSEMRQRLKAAFERFINADECSDDQIARLIRSLEIDILVDLKGFTQHSRTDIFARRPAPIQVNYLGFPGTMGAPYIDYIIADRIIIPENQYQWYSEKIVSLPDSYQVNDRKRAVANRVFARTEMGLPTTDFVYASFNNNYKITPRIFESWMRILRNVEGSVLWLYESNPAAASNLRKEALARGVEPRRLIFAKGMPLSEHLARLRLADLFLDTLPYNAHTTASDALWAGLPVLTCLGDTFAGRVAASLLHAIKLPELITTTLDDYEALAIQLATKPEQLAIIKQKLAENRLTTPLFNTKRFTKNIEAAYTAMYQRHQAGLAPDHILCPQDL